MSFPKKSLSQIFDWNGPIWKAWLLTTTLFILFSFSLLLCSYLFYQYRPCLLYNEVILIILFLGHSINVNCKQAKLQARYMTIEFLNIWFDMKLKGNVWGAVISKSEVIKHFQMNHNLTPFVLYFLFSSLCFLEGRGELIKDNYSGVQKLLYCDSPIIISCISSFHYLTKIFKASFRIKYQIGHVIQFWDLNGPLKARKINYLQHIRP